MRQWSLQPIVPANAAEQKMLDAAADGEWPDFRTQKMSRKVLRASFLRYLLFYLSHSGMPWGLRVAGVHIDGKLDLVDCTGLSGAALPSLTLEECGIPEAIDISGARLARFSIKNSRITHVCAHGARIDGPFQFSGVKGFGFQRKNEEIGIAWISARGARIEGDVDGYGAQLRAPVRPRREILPGQQRYALGLGNSLVRGRVSLFGGFRADGGVSFGDAEIHGECWLDHACVTAGEGDAFRAQSTRFHASVILKDGFKARGEVSFLGARIAGSLECSDALFVNRLKDGSATAIKAAYTTIDGPVSLNDSKIFGSVNFQNSKISGFFSGDNSIFNNRTSDGGGIALNIASTEFGGDVTLMGAACKAFGYINLSNAKVAGDLLFVDATLENCVATEFRGQNQRFTLGAQNASIGGDLFLDRATSIGEISLWGARIGKKFSFDGATLIGSPFAISAPHLFVAGDLMLENLKLLGNIWLPQIEVGGAMSWDGLCLITEHAHGSKKFQHTYVSRLTFNDAKIGGELQTKNLSSRRSVKSAPSYSDPQSDPNLRIEIDLSGTRAAALDDRWPRGWGGEKVLEQGLMTLRLDGFVYDRIADFPADQKSTRVQTWLDKVLHRSIFYVKSFFVAVVRQLARVCEHIARQSAVIAPLFNWLGKKAGVVVMRMTHQPPRRFSAETRLNWLRLQSSTEFFPQPYRHLARVLRTHGHVEAARQVAIQEEWRTPAQGFYRFLKVLFGVGFGFGLSTQNATVVLLLFILTGWYGAHRALVSNVMVQNVAPVASVAIKEQGELQMALPNGKTADATADVPCTDQVIPFFYVLDVMLPVIPLHQETVCDISPKHPRWRLGKLTFSVLGKLVTTLALITFSGVLKARAEE